MISLFCVCYLLILFNICDIPFHQIRRMKQIEQERDVLLQGLDAVERAREWYVSQINNVAERQIHAEKTSVSVR